jgi:hypothetical protein
MRHEPNISNQIITAATNDLILLLQIGTVQERLMRIFALQELVTTLPPEALMNRVASFDPNFKNEQKNSC